MGGRKRTVRWWIESIISILGLVIFVGLIWKPKLQEHDWKIGDCFENKDVEEWEVGQYSKIVREGKENWGVVVWLPREAEWSDNVVSKSKAVMAGRWFAPLNVRCPDEENEH